MFARSILLAIAGTAIIVMSSVYIEGAEFTSEGGMLVRIYEPYAAHIRSIADAVVRILTICLIALPFQVLLPAVRRAPKIRNYEFWLDLIYSLQSAWLAPVYFFAVVYWVINAAYGGNPIFPQLAHLPIWLQVLFSIWAFDFAVYWRHRWEHTFSVLWSFHAVHHTTERLDVLTTNRLHPFELALGAFFNAAITKLGIHPAAATIGFSVYLYYNYFIHMNVRVRYPGVLKYIFVSPFMHHWHHAKEPVAIGKNVGVVFAWNDWIFGTAYHPDGWPLEYGIDVPADERVGQSYLRQLLYPLQFFTARTMAWRAARASRPQVRG